MVNSTPKSGFGGGSVQKARRRRTARFSRFKLLGDLQRAEALLWRLVSHGGTSCAWCDICEAWHHVHVARRTVERPGWEMVKNLPIGELPPRGPSWMVP